MEHDAGDREAGGPHESKGGEHGERERGERAVGAPRSVRNPSTGTVEDHSSAFFHAGAQGPPARGTTPVEGLRTDREREFAHEPVLRREVVDLFAPVPPGVVVDATLGAAGHARALLEAHAHLEVLGLDRDADAVEAAGRALAAFGGRATVCHAPFSHLADALTERRPGLEGVSGVLFDLGVSSPQLDRGERGFSYRADAPLDMRMDRSGPLTAADVVNTWDEAALARIFADNGEGRFARRIARAVVAARPISTTGELAGVVRDAIPAATRRTGGHPARRVFQAVRIAVNDELGQLATGLASAIDLLVPGGRCVVISYHSGEDRLVKEVFATESSGGCTCPPGLPCVCGAEPRGHLVFRGSRRPGAEEIARNRRAESARLRAWERGR